MLKKLFVPLVLTLISPALADAATIPLIQRITLGDGELYKPDGPDVIYYSPYTAIEPVAISEADRVLVNYQFLDKEALHVSNAVNMYVQVDLLTNYTGLPDTERFLVDDFGTYSYFGYSGPEDGKNRFYEVRGSSLGLSGIDIFREEGPYSFDGFRFTLESGSLAALPDDLMLVGVRFSVTAIEGGPGSIDFFGSSEPVTLMSANNTASGVSLAAVPAPAALPLLAGGMTLFGMLGLRRRKRRQQAQLG